MRDFKHNNSATQYVKKYNRDRAVLIGIVALIVITGISTARLFKSRSGVIMIRKDLEREKASLVEKQQNLEASLRTFTEEEGIDRAIRNTHRAVKEGEEMVVLISGDDNVAQ